MKNFNKKILLISHNPLSRVNNNGKTLVSIFDVVPAENIYQIYLNSDVPDYSEGCHYLQINEKQIIQSVLSGKNNCCQEIVPTTGNVSSATIKVGSFGIHTKRLFREFIWKFSVWKSELKKWLSDKHFDVVFFMAGDGLFAYDVYRLVMKSMSAKGCLFFTDDYIIGKTSSSPVAYLRRYLLKKKIRNTMPLIRELYVISDEMKDAYRKLLGINSCVIRNFSEEKEELIKKNTSYSQNDCLTMVYAGGLHYNRWKVLAQVANALKEINLSKKTKCYLKIYSSQNISKDIMKKINVEGASEFCGCASASQIAGVYAGADILLHVESFDKKAIASTKYSFSTKIPEYLSSGKCLMAVAPAEVASYKYLSEFAFVVSDIEELSSQLARIVTDSEFRNMIKSNCEDHYEMDFSKKKKDECLNRILSV